jgi:sodium-dependent dicarboxylate transporter 2/3/5
MSSRYFVLIGGVIAAGIAFMVLRAIPYPSEVCWTAAITLLCAILWITEALPIPVTAMIALALFPSVGILTPAEVGQAIGSPTVLLVLGGFILSASMVASGAHRRVAIGMVNLIGGTSSRRVVFGFMGAAAFLSLWISNGATSLMLLPVALAVLERAEDPRLATPLLLGMAYAASIGGLGTPIGTPANLVFIQVYGDTTGESIDFLTWMSWGLPVALLLLPVCFFWISRGLTHKRPIELPQSGEWRPAEKRVLIVFAITACAWMTRTQPFGGWSTLVGLPAISDASIAVLAAVSLFIVPDGRGGRLLDWESASRIPWGILILLGSGFTIARAFTESGLSAILGDALSGLSSLPVIAMIAGLCLVVTFMTELTSNTATTALLMPVLAAAALATGLDPILLMLPAALTASCAFMLPTATTPNTVVFSSGNFPIRKMVAEGFILNLLGVAVVTLASYFLLYR